MHAFVAKVQVAVGAALKLTALGGCIKLHCISCICSDKYENQKYTAVNNVNRLT